MCETCSKSSIKNQNDAWRLSGVFNVNFEHITHLTHITHITHVPLANFVQMNAVLNKKK